MDTIDLQAIRKLGAKAWQIYIDQSWKNSYDVADFMNTILYIMYTILYTILYVFESFSFDYIWMPFSLSLVSLCSCWVAISQWLINKPEPVARVPAAFATRLTFCLLSYPTFRSLTHSLSLCPSLTVVDFLLATDFLMHKIAHDIISMKWLAASTAATGTGTGTGTVTGTDTRATSTETN